MRFVIVTGMSGAGKSQALKILEDFGFYCVDNLPLPLLKSFADWASEQQDAKKIALGLDIRNGRYMNELESRLAEATNGRLKTEILFLDASNECLMIRFKETRRTHPLEEECGGLQTGIEEERSRLQSVRSGADYIIDTSHLLTRELKLLMRNIFIGEEGYNSLNATIVSFGYKYGIPRDADVVFDARFLPNPFYVDTLKHKFGTDPEVADYVMNCDEAPEFIEKLTDFTGFLLDSYVREGRTRAVIAIGCTGGQHRSVAVACKLYENLKGRGFGLKIEHREMKNG